MSLPRIAGSFFGIGSTVFSGLANVVVQLLAAIVLTASEFGVFAISAATIIFVVGLARTVVGQTDLIRGRSSNDKGAATAAYAVAFILLGAGGVILAGSWIVGMRGVDTYYAVGVAVAVSAVFVVQDSLRFRAFRAGKPAVAFVSDVLMVITTFIGIVVMYLTETQSVWALVTAWTLGAAVGVSAAVGLLAYWPGRMSRGSKWLGSHRDLIIPVAGEFMLQSGFPYLVNFVILAVGGVDALAGYRLIQLLFAAVGNVSTGLNATLVPKLVNSRDPALAARQGRLQFIVATLIASVLVASVYWFPTPWGLAIFGGNWVEMQPFIWVGALHGWVNAIAISNYSLLRVLGFARFSFWVRLASTVLSMALVAFAVWMGGAVAVAWALALPAIGAYLVRVLRASARLRSIQRSGEMI